MRNWRNRETRTRPRDVLRAGLFLLLAGAILAPAERPAPRAAGREDGPGSRTLTVSAASGLLTVDAANVSLEELLRAIGEASGLTVDIRGHLASPFVVWSFERLPVSEAIRRLLPDNSYALVYRPSPAKVSDGGARRLVVYGSGNFVGRDAREPPQTANAAPPDILLRDGRVKRLSVSKEGDEIGELVVILSNAADLYAREQAVDTIAEIGGPRAVEALAVGLGDDSEFVREKVVQALVGFPSEAAVMALGQTYFGDPDLDVRLMALRSLSKLPGEAARAIIETVAREGETPAREEAAEALKKLN